MDKRAKRKNVARVFDEYLIASIKAGDRAAFERLARLWQGKLFAHAYRLIGDIEIAKDVTQDGWADIIKGLPRLKETSVFPAWAYRIITRRAADHIRRMQRKRRTEAAYAAEPQAADMAAHGVEVFADKTPLGRAIEKLPPKQRAVIALFYLEDFSITEISVALAVPAGTIKTRLLTARKNLRSHLKEN